MTTKTLVVEVKFIHALYGSELYVPGQGGIGKSTAMKHLAVIWSDGTLREIQKFDFLFHISLKNVRKNQSIEHMIIEQHKGLSGNSVQLEEITTILDGPTSRKILLLLDGYDEYKPGSNADIDTAITRCSLRNCCVIITSRETNEVPKFDNIRSRILPQCTQ